MRYFFQEHLAEPKLLNSFCMHHVNACTLTHLIPQMAFPAFTHVKDTCKYRCGIERVSQNVSPPPLINISCFYKSSSLLLSSFVWNARPLLPCLRARNRKSQFFSKALSLKSWVSTLEEEQMCCCPYCPCGVFCLLRNLVIAQCEPDQVISNESEVCF